MRKSFLIIIGIFALTAILINILLDNPKFSNLYDKIEFEIKSNQPELAEQTLLQLIRQDIYGIENHYQYINTHFDIPEKRKVGKNRYEYRDDNTIRNFYSTLALSGDTQLSDIGKYGQGLISVHLLDYSGALSEFLKVKNTSLKYYNNSIGNVYYQLDSINKAEFHFRKEIEMKGNIEGAYSNLVELLYSRNKTKELHELLENKDSKPYFPSSIEREIYFKEFMPVKYSIELIKRVFSGLNIWGFIAAFLIMGSWIMYLRKLDIFEVEKWRYIIVTVLLGMFFSFLTYPLSDFDNLIFGFRLNGGLINDFFYSVIGIGAIEEFVKIVPLLLMLKYTKAIDEPFDYIKYASLSALGFAFIENLIYFNESNLHIIHGRALTAVVSHMFDSSIIAYGLILNKYKRHYNPLLNFLFFFTLASLSHGFYDFWLINKLASNFSIITLLYLFASMYMWNSFKNNALNHSDFFDKDKSVDSEKLLDYLLYSLSGVLLFEYIALAIKFSPEVANIGIVASLYSGTYLILFLSGHLSQVTLNKGVWAPIKYWSEKDEVNSINYDEIVNCEIQINPFTKNDLAYKYLPNKGLVLKRITVSEEPDWYLIKIDNVKEINSFMNDFVIIRTKDKFEQIEIGNKKVIAFYIIPNDTNLDKEILKRTDFKFCGWATSE